MTAIGSLENGDSKPYWEGVRNRRLLFQACASCGKTQFPPRFQCSDCWGTDLAWTESCGRGVVESYTVVRRAPLAADRGRVPYVAVAVRMEEGPRMIANLLGADPMSVTIGDPVHVVFDDTTGTMLPQFELVARSGGKMTSAG